ncbi:MAG: PilC/PilY family type IV pilus protein [Halothiobacillaceae bacterium]|nr:PilC/PilY family type IV pilus protein [Halothiobacillaceae bacterium]
MFILDDSGSMHWEAMPDALTYSEYMFPPPSHVYGNANYSDGNEYIVAFDDTSSVNTRTRSWYNNKVHYNPNITYTPWVKYDGTSYGNANATRARFNPYTTGGTCNAVSDPNNQCIDLTIEQKYTKWVNKGSTHSDKYWPITFYQYKGTGSLTSYKSYIKYQIRGSSGYTKDLNGGSESSVSSFTWPGGITRTVAEERQNFANWFSYYRSRILSVRGGTGLAFQNLDPKSFRVGFTTINHGGILYQVPITSSPVDGNFADSYKQNFYERLYQWPMPTSGTPLRRALNVVGKYYQNTTSGGPWAPDIGGAGLQVSCRQSFAILTTDGYWNGPNQSVGNEDGTDGSTITGPNDASFKYIAETPYKDSRSDTLADVAMKYWKTDLRPEAFMTNDVPVSSADPAFWQHMSTFGVSLGANGTLDPKTDLPNLKSGAKTWPDPFSVTAAKIDDLWHATINGRGAFVAAQDPNEYADALKKTLGAISDRVASASNLSANSTSLGTDTKIFQAKFKGGTWEGELTAYKASDLSIIWLGTAGIQASPASSRNIQTWNGTSGVPFKWASLPTAAQTALDYDATTSNGNDDWIVEYLRGDTSKEMQYGGTLRNRSARLGDIVHSSPVYSADTDTVFVGANDGMLHAFDATTGTERFAYIPGQFLTTGLKTLSEPNYVHRYFVDGQIAISTKAQTPGENHLVAALGAGGKGLFGLNVTAPGAFGASNVSWEFTSDTHMGFILGKVAIAKLNTGELAVLTGNGYNSSSEQSALYVFSLKTGALIKRIPTGAGSATATNGLTTPKGVDVDKNGTLDYVYAGDLLGNMWKFDLSGADTSWGIANSGAPLFVAKDANGKRQPITGGVAIATNPYEGPFYGKRYIMFGTGQYINASDVASTDVQTWYGLIDDGNVTIQRSDLAQRTIETVADKYGYEVRSFSKAVAGDMVGKKGWYVDLKVGNAAQGERIVSDSSMDASYDESGATMPVLRAASITLGGANVCQPSGTGYLNFIDPFTGGSLSTSYIDLNKDGQRDSLDLIDPNNPDSVVGSIAIKTGTPSEPLDVGKNILIDDGNGRSPTQLDSFKQGLSGRRTWHEIKN